MESAGTEPWTPEPNRLRCYRSFLPPLFALIRSLSCAIICTGAVIWVHFRFGPGHFRCS